MEMARVRQRHSNTFRLKNDWQLEFGGELHSRGYSQNLYISNVYLDLTAAVQTPRAACSHYLSGLMVMVRV